MVVALTLPRVFTPPLRDLGELDASWGHDMAWFCDDILDDPLSDHQEWLSMHALEVLTKEKALEFAMLEDDPAAEIAKVERLYSPPEVRGGRPIPNGRLRFTKCLILISRQNGKTDWVKKLIKWAIFRKRMPEVMAAAQTLNKSIDLWNEILLEIERHPKLRKILGRVDHSKGAQAMWTKGKRQRYRPVGIDENAGRGDTVDLLYIDELRTQKDFTGVNSLEATTAVPDNGLIVITSNAGVGHSVVLRDYRGRAKRPLDEGTWRDTRMGLFEWSADPSADIDDVEGWKQANPDLGNGRITMATLAGFRESKSEAAFRTEHLCQWVDELGDDFEPIVPFERWGSLAVERRVAVGECVLAVEVSPDSESVTFVSAGQTSRGVHLEQRGGDKTFEVESTVEAIRRFVAENDDPAAVVLDKDSPAGVLVPHLQAVGIEPVLLNGGMVAGALREMKQAVADGRLTHDGAQEWVSALRVATVRDGGGRYPSIERFSGDVSVLVAGTFALWALNKFIAEFQVPYKQVEVEKKNPVGTFPVFSRKKLMGGVLVG